LQKNRQRKSPLPLKSKPSITRKGHQRQGRIDRDHVRPTGMMMIPVFSFYAAHSLSITVVINTFRTEGEYDSQYNPGSMVWVYIDPPWLIKKILPGD
jgi:hypothetical protein